MDINAGLYPDYWTLIAVSLCEGGEKVLLHFIQETPGDLVPLEDITKALRISASVRAGVRPQVRRTPSGDLYFLFKVT